MNRISLSVLVVVLVLSEISTATAAAVFRLASGANPAAIQTAVDQFRADLGGANNGVGGSFTNGRREINWDGVPDSFSLPNFIPGDFFNVNSPRGAVFGSPSSSFNTNANFMVSANAASGTAVRFGNIDPSYSAIFQTFSAERLFAVRSGNQVASVLSIQFFVPGTEIPATVKGFGAVFSDIDANANVLVRVYGTNGKQLTVSASAVQASNNGLSFFGVSFNAGERIARVEMLVGNASMASGVIDGTNGVDLVAMDDFIYGEPRAMQFHSADFDGDGTSDLSVFRPSNGGWFALNSGSNTFSVNFFGTAGDIPVDGDFDGDQRADFVVFRPSTGTWFRQNSSNGQFVQNQFGANGDKPVPGDYDKDGKTDIAVWRPNGGNYFILRSSDGGFSGAQWGATGDIPLAGAAQ